MPLKNYKKTTITAGVVYSSFNVNSVQSKCYNLTVIANLNSNILYN